MVPHTYHLYQDSWNGPVPYLQANARPLQRRQQQPQPQEGGREAKAVRPCWRGAGGGKGYAAAYASFRDRHDYLVADRSRVSLSWGHRWARGWRRVTICPAY
jgi:hypothetical protein